MKKNPEILAPAGSRQQLEAAAEAGADAVYLGLQGLNARQGARNFEPGELAETVAYCHARNIRVYVTLNTLVSDEELPEAEKAIEAAAVAGADALIVQDMAVFRLARTLYPKLPLHASTQMAIHNTWGVALLERLGLDRAVLARELSLAEIRQIARSTSLPLEVFVHGAHCTSVSGNCYLSSLIGGRSGNRGLCAQPCRLDFRLGERSFALSLKDLSVVDRLDQLREAGVDSFKIEGRLKRPEYVSAAVKACRDALAGRPVDTAQLKALFSRSGFTDGYLTGQRNAGMFGHRTRDDVQASAAALGSLSSLPAGEQAPTPVDMTLIVASGKPSTLLLSQGRHTLKVSGAIPRPSLERDLTPEMAERSLRKTGGTPFALTSFLAKIEEGLTLSAAELNALRRAGLEALAEARNPRVVYARETKALDPLPAYDPPDQPQIRLRFEYCEQIFPEALDYPLILPLHQILANPDILKGREQNMIGEIPSLVFPSEEEGVIRQLDTLAGLGLRRMLADNPGAAAQALGMGFRVHGGPALNLLNSYGLEEYRQLGLEDATLSIEGSFSQVRKLGGTLPRGVIGYGYLPLMKLRACPARGPGGCGSCKGLQRLRDPKGIEFTLICRERMYSELLNSVPLYVADKSIPRLDFQTLYFTTESKEACKAILRLYTEKKPPAFARTGGLYFRKLL